MMQTIRSVALGLAIGLAALPLASAATPAGGPDAITTENVRKQIVTLPFYSIFDHVTFQLDDGVVTLNGSVYRPSLRKSVERVALQVEGVNSVVNNVEILPASFHDDRIRLAVVRSLYSNPVLNRYGIQSVPPIHVIVRNGDVTLEGMVNREMERNVAGILANGVAGVFSVTNNLRLDRR